VVEELTTPAEDITEVPQEVVPIEDVDKKSSILNALKINMTKKINGTDKWG
jgi:hypothetical protein